MSPPNYFLANLARVIISDVLIIFIHYDGNVTANTIECLGENERILIKGINKTDASVSKFSWLPSKDDGASKRYISRDQIDVSGFKAE